MTRDELALLTMDEAQRQAIPASPFNPAGPGYDMASAVAGGLKPDDTGHWPSRVPETGLILKGRAHPTYPLTLQGEKDAGYQIEQRDGRDYSFPVGSLADQSMSPHERAALGVQQKYRGISPPGTSGLEKFATSAVNLPGNILSARARLSQNYPQAAIHMLQEPVRKARGVTEAVMDMSAETNPLQTMAPGETRTISTDYDPRRQAAALGAETSLNLLGLPALGVSAPMGSLAAGAARRELVQPRIGDINPERNVKFIEGKPRLVEAPSHNYSKVVTGKLPEEAVGEIANVQNISPPIKKPDEVFKPGQYVIFAPGDRTRTGGELVSVGGTKLRTPQPMEGGPGYADLNKPAIWANAKAAASRLLETGTAAKELSGQNPLLSYTALGPRSMDSSRQAANVAVDLAQQAEIMRKGRSSINEFMRRPKQASEAEKNFPGKDFPGWDTKAFDEWFANATGAERSKLVKALDRKEIMKYGGPDIGESRIVQTDPRLYNTPTGSTGLTISEFDPARGTAPSGHSTYNTDIFGGKTVSLGGSVPFHMIGKDITDVLKKAGEPVRFANRPDYYLLQGLPGGIPPVQKMTQQGIDRLSTWYEQQMGRHGKLWSNVTDKKTGAAILASQQQPPFYSAVERAVESSKQNAAPGSQWLGTLRNTPGVKPEEIEALGLGKLFEQPGSVSKQTVLDQIAANKVNVGEVRKGGYDYERAGALTNERSDVRAELNLARTQIRAGQGSREERLARVQELADRDQALTNQIAAVGEGPTKFQQYTLPGGENYREMLLTLPPKEVTKPGPFGEPTKYLAPGETTFRSSHYDEPNILAHVRYNDRVIDGKKTLFVEEVQSDWHQAGKKRGYKGDDPQPLIERAEAARQAVSNRYEELPALASDGKYKTKREILDAGDNAVFSKYQRLLREDQQTGRLAELDRAHDAAVSALNRAREGVPDAPFKTTWPDLAMKRIIREAAEKGYDKVAWTPGSVQADRYDLSKHIKEVKFEKAGTGGFDRLDDIDAGTFGTLIARDHNGKEVMRQHMDAKELPDHIGKDVADKLLGQKPAAENRSGMALASRSLSGLDLKVGGEGMKGFYDEILPATVNKLVKKHGARVEKSKINSLDENKLYEDLIREGHLPGRAEELVANKMLESGGGNQPVHVFDITPQLREQAMKGFPLFTLGGAVAGGTLGSLADQSRYEQ